MTNPQTSTPEFFEAKYGAQPDPWNFATSDYELSRYDAILAALSHRRYHCIFEPGCSIGVLTERLAPLGDSVVAVDFSPTAVAQAQARCAHLFGVNIECTSFPERIAQGGFDLIVLSEIGYYFSAQEWATLTARAIHAMVPGATLLASHWLGHSEDHRITGDAVHEILRTNHQLKLEHSERHAAFRLDRWIRV
jgi:SAM-dependent methyltransferase